MYYIKTNSLVIRVREVGEATRYFCIVGTVIRWLLLLLLILILIWLAAISPPWGELTTAFVVCSFGFSKTKFSLIPEVSRSLFVHSLHLQTLVNVNIAFWILQSAHAIQGSLINNKGFLFRLLLAAGGELIISDLNPYRLFPLHWWLIRNDLDALISAFPIIKTSTGLNVLELLLSITMINYSSTSSIWLWHNC